MRLWDRITRPFRRQPQEPAKAPPSPPPPKRPAPPAAEPVSPNARLRFEGPDYFREAYRQGRLTHEFFLAAVQRVPALLWDFTAGQRAGEVTLARWQRLGEPLSKTLEEFVDRLVLERLQGAEDKWGILLNVARFAGPAPLLRCCEIVERRSWPSLGRPPEHPRRADPVAPKQVVAHVLGNLSAIPDDTQTIEALRAFSAKTLLTAAALSEEATAVLEAALGWPGLAQVVRLARQVQQRGPTTCRVDAQARAAVLAALTALGAERGQPLLATLRAHGFESAVVLEALMDWNCPALEHNLAKGSPLAAAAYGALPESNDPLRRYLLLKQVLEGAGAYAGQKQHRLRRAAEVGMENLALVCGYEDRTRLTWAMEAQLTAAREAELPPPQVPAEEEIGPCRARLDVREGAPEIEVTIGEQPLRQPPPELEATPQMRRLRREKERWEEEAAGLPSTLEDMMVRRRPLGEMEVAYLAGSPVGKQVLARVVMICADRTGLLDPDAQTFVDLDGAQWQPEGETRVAHPYDLWRLRELERWRDALLEKQITQPFAQAFRELYSLSLEERQLVTASPRFEGVAVEEACFAQALNERGWLRAADDRLARHAETGLQACVALQRDAENPSRTAVGRVWLEDEKGTRLSLERSPAVSVSEALAEVGAAVLASAETLPATALEPVAAARAAYLVRLCARAGAVARVADFRLEVRGPGGPMTLDLLLRPTAVSEEEVARAAHAHVPHPDTPLAVLASQLEEVVGPAAVAPAAAHQSR